jgi:hypothetical protein
MYHLHHKLSNNPTQIHKGQVLYKTSKDASSGPVRRQPHGSQVPILDRIDALIQQMMEEQKYQQEINNLPKCIKNKFFHACTYVYRCPRRNVPDFGRIFLILKYTDVTQNTYVQIRTVTEIMAREECGLLSGQRTVLVS